MGPPEPKSLRTLVRLSQKLKLPCLRPSLTSRITAGQSSRHPLRNSTSRQPKFDVGSGRKAIVIFVPFPQIKAWKKNSLANMLSFLPSDEFCLNQPVKPETKSRSDH